MNRPGHACYRRRVRVGSVLLQMALVAVLVACGDDDGPGDPDAGPDASDLGVDASDDGGDADAEPDAEPDARDDDTGPAECTTSPSADRGVVCGVVTRDPTLPTDGTSPHDGRGELFVFAFDCDPFVSEGIAACRGREPRIVSDSFHHVADADLGALGAAIPYELRGIPESVVYVAAVMLDSPHDLSEGLLPGDWATRPATLTDVAAGESRVIDVELDTLVRGMRVLVRRDARLDPLFDGVGSLAVVGYTREPMPGDRAELGAVYGCADFSFPEAEALVLVSSFEAASHWLLPFLDDDGSGLESGPSPGDLLGLPPSRVDIAEDDVIVDVELELTEVLDRSSVDAGPADGGSDGGPAPGCGDAGAG